MSDSDERLARAEERLTRLEERIGTLERQFTAAIRDSIDERDQFRKTLEQVNKTLRDTLGSSR
jgi:prefoldin subunit 5